MTWRPVVPTLTALAAALSALLPAACAPASAGDGVPAGSAGESYVVMLSLDGLRPSYLERVATPSLDRVAAGGVRAESLIPVYPTRTFPNHYSIATGMYPSRHGLVDNSFLDPALGLTYRIADRSAVRDARFYGGEPIWATASRQGLLTAAYYWVGTEAPVGGVQPDVFRYYDRSVPNAARVDAVLGWLGRPESERPRLVLLYFSEPDAAGHAHGPDAPAVDSAVAAVDREVGRLLDGIRALPHGDRVNLIVVSDHGMLEVPAGSEVRLRREDVAGARVVYSGTHAALHFDGDTARLEAAYAALRQVEGATVYRRDETPERWRYRHNPRIGDLHVVTEPGRAMRWPGAPGWTGGGMHGWDPALPAMHGVFLATGPGFREGATVPAFENIHIHPLVARLLGIDPAPGIDGRLDAVTPLLRQRNR